MRVGAAAVGAITTGGLASFATGAPAHDINLADKGLQDGDLIDPYLDSYFGAGDTVFVPDGTYDWDGSGMHDPVAGSELVTNGSANVTFQLTSGSSFTDGFHEGGIRISGFTVRGTAAASPKCGWDIEPPSGTQIVFEDIRLPDGCEGEGRAFYTSGHSGTGVIRNMLFAGFSSDTIYTDNGPMHVENCVCIDNNISMIRVGVGDNVVKNCLLIYDGDAPPNENGDVNVRGIRIRDPGGYTEIVGCDLVWTNSQAPSNPIEIDDDSAPSEGVIRDTRIYNDTTTSSIGYETGTGFSADGLHLTGSNTDADGLSGDICTGSGCEEPRSDYSYTTPADFTGGPLGDGSSGGGTCTGEYTLRLHAAIDNPSPMDVTFTVDGTIALGDQAESGEDVITDNGDGTMTLTSTDFEADAVDTYTISGQVVSYDYSRGYDLDVSVDGQPTTFAKLADYSPVMVAQVGSSLDYDFTVADDVVVVNDNTATVSGTTITGTIAAGEVHSFHVKGAITDFNYSHTDFALYRDGEDVTASHT